ncbi:MAG: DUF393 domain-containing protein [Candidatus Omnitrophica bacterium]|nr:DUF393 domain-containing protein [Candidatus Omnitrophota bacterium]
MTSEGSRGSLPVMLYDGDCSFCQRWIDRWRKMTGDRIAYEPYQKALSRFPQLTQAQCQTAVQLIAPDGSVFSAAHAVLKALALSGKAGFFLWCYEQVPFFNRISEWAYQVVSGHRTFLSNPFRAPKCKT